MKKQARAAMVHNRKRQLKVRIFLILLLGILICLIINFSGLMSTFMPLKEIASQKIEINHTDLNNVNDWYLVLVNRSHPIKDQQTPELTQLSNGESVDSRIYPELQKMFDDMRATGIYPIVASGFRTAKEQQQLLDDKVNEYRNDGYTRSEAKEMALYWVADPGTSEHETGLAVDINADKKYSSSEEVYVWLKQNAYKYGFINRYPEDKVSITQVTSEPWHYRYVGKKAAKEMYQQNLCLEEYLGKY